MLQKDGFDFMNNAIVAVKNLIRENESLKKENALLRKKIGFNVEPKVLVGDVWHYPPNAEYKDKGIYRVVEVKKNSAYFEDGNRNPIDNMLTSGEWYLLERKIK